MSSPPPPHPLPPKPPTGSPSTLPPSQSHSPHPIPPKPPISNDSNPPPARPPLDFNTALADLQSYHKAHMETAEQFVKLDYITRKRHRGVFMENIYNLETAMKHSTLPLIPSRRQEADQALVVCNAILENLAEVDAVIDRKEREESMAGSRGDKSGHGNIRDMMSTENNEIGKKDTEKGPQTMSVQSQVTQDGYKQGNQAIPPDRGIPQITGHNQEEGTTNGRDMVQEENTEITRHRDDKHMEPTHIEREPKTKMMETETETTGQQEANAATEEMTQKLGTTQLQQKELEMIELEKQESDKREMEKVEAGTGASETIKDGGIEVDKGEVDTREAVEVDRREAENMALEKRTAQKIAFDKMAAELMAAVNITSERRTAERIAAEKMASEKMAAEKIEAEKMEGERRDADRKAAEKIEAERIEVQRTESEKKDHEKRNQDTAYPVQQEFERQESDLREKNIVANEQIYDDRTLASAPQLNEVTASVQHILNALFILQTPHSLSSEETKEFIERREKEFRAQRRVPFSTLSPNDRAAAIEVLAYRIEKLEFCQTDQALSEIARQQTTDFLVPGREYLELLKNNHRARKMAEDNESNVRVTRRRKTKLQIEVGMNIESEKQTDGGGNVQETETAATEEVWIDMEGLDLTKLKQELKDIEDGRQKQQMDREGLDEGQQNELSRPKQEVGPSDQKPQGTSLTDRILGFQIKNGIPTRVPKQPSDDTQDGDDVTMTDSEDYEQAIEQVQSLLATQKLSDPKRTTRSETDTLEADLEKMITEFTKATQNLEKHSGEESNDILWGNARVHLQNLMRQRMGLAIARQKVKR